ncbi:ArsR/SmtB family transcription factor [Limisalsivibrio acetivorans]|uniref:ArsR/SmtB family transcription factor n=1 Tax=Limisalsivibrio acetivorans TaxID=1304888 RepID=UPI0003B3BA09|nr:metalloregulator ArsR/SmtB family transcription factor [Limisalsivibrio acetivorans]
MQISDHENITCSVKFVNEKRLEEALKDALGERELDDISSTFKALGDPTRLKLLYALQGGEMCVCDISAFLGISESATSHQLRKLKDMRLIKQRRDKQMIYYSLDDEHVSSLIDVCLEHVRHR